MDPKLTDALETSSADVLCSFLNRKHFSRNNNKNSGCYHNVFLVILVSKYLIQSDMLVLKNI